MEYTFYEKKERCGVFLLKNIILHASCRCVHHHLKCHVSMVNAFFSECVLSPFINLNRFYADVCINFAHLTHRVRAAQQAKASSHNELTLCKRWHRFTSVIICDRIWIWCTECLHLLTNRWIRVHLHLSILYFHSFATEFRPSSLLKFAWIKMLSFSSSKDMKQLINRGCVLHFVY